MITTNAVDRGALLRSIVFYAGGVLLLVAIWNRWIGDVLPSGPANQIGHNSEAYLLALLVCAWVQYAVPRSAALGPGVHVLVGLVAGLAAVGIAVALKRSDLESHYSTLNETFFALGFVLPYLHLPRRPRLLAVVLSLALVIGLLVANDTEVVVKGAEAWVVLVLAPLTFDIFDRTLVDPDAEESHLLRLLWMAVLVALPVVAALLDGELSGNAEGIRDYVSRANEAFLGLLIVHAYFGYWVRSARPGRPLRRSA